MIQGTGSHVGKSLVVAGLCRAFTRRGLKVAPFKPQNMSNNAAVTADGGEIGRAQALQARACGIPASRHMNPILLKPEGEGVAQLIVQGKREARMGAMAFHAKKPSLMPRIMESFNDVSKDRDLVLVEGAGSPAEINLRAGDIANMGFAEEANLPVVIVADIDRGGAIASLVGTQALLDFGERMRVRGIIINKFRGDVRLFEPALDLIAGRTGWRSFGVLPWFDGASRLPDEDSVALSSPVIPANAGIQGPSPGETALDSRLRGSDEEKRPIKIAVLKLPRIANFDDLDPLRAEADVKLDFIAPGTAIPGDADLVIIPGSKATIADLHALRETGWHIDLAAHHRRGGRILGICAGYQMLGRSVADPGGVEGPPETVPGLGLLDVTTVMATEKTLRAVVGEALGQSIAGYEMHMGVTSGADAARPMAMLNAASVGEVPPILTFPLQGGRNSVSSPSPLEGEGGVGGMHPEGAVSRDGLVMGCTIHGLFASDAYRRAFLATLRPDRTSSLSYEAMIEDTLDALAAHLEKHLDLDGLLAAAKGERGELSLEVPRVRG
ncbi:MAG TPA: cobyric acid synthase [Magnetospirillaceae bacterium]